MIFQGNNSVLVYFIENGTDLPYTIDSKGQIKVNGPIDREVQDIYRFEVWWLENTFVCWKLQIML